MSWNYMLFPVSAPTLKLDSNKIIEFSMVRAVFPSIVFGEEVRTLHHQHPNSIPETVDSMEHLYAPSYLRSPVCFLSVKTSCPPGSDTIAKYFVHNIFK